MTIYTSKKTGAVYTIGATETDKNGKTVYELISNEDHTNTIHVTDSTLKRWYKKSVLVDFTKADEKPETKKATNITPEKLEKITDKIQKLLALAGNNPSEEEAQAALLKAQALMAEYSISQEAVKGPDAEYTYAWLHTKVRARKPHNALGCIIANSFACKCLIDTDKKVSFFGRSDNAAAAVSAMEFTFKAMFRGANKAVADNGVKPGYKGSAPYYNAYMYGFLKGLKVALDAQTVALAIIVPEDVTQEFSKKFTDLRAYGNRKSEVTVDSSCFNSGYRDGLTVMDKRSLA